LADVVAHCHAGSAATTVDRAGEHGGAPADRARGVGLRCIGGEPGEVAPPVLLADVGGEDPRDHHQPLVLVGDDLAGGQPAWNLPQRIDPATSVGVIPA